MFLVRGKSQESELDDEKNNQGFWCWPFPLSPGRSANKKSSERSSKNHLILQRQHLQSNRFPQHFGTDKMEIRPRIQISTAHMATVLMVFMILLHDVAEAGRQSKNMKGPPLSPKFGQDNLDNHTVRVGHEVQFSCTVENLGNYKVAWLHSEKGTFAVYPIVVTQNDRMSVSFDNRATYNLKLQNIQESDAGKYICQINTGPVISISGTLSVVVPPDIIDEDSSSDTLATEGMRVLLNCRATGNPIPTISWVREDGSKIRVCKSDKSVSEGRSSECEEVAVHHGSDLELRQVSRFDSGEYQCLANNGIPPTVSKRVRLYVDFSPTLWISHQRVGAQVGSTAVLECLTAAYPPSLNFWSKDGSDVITEKPGKYGLIQSSGKPRLYNIQMKIRIQNITAEDFGTYSCSARNPQGVTDGEIKLYEILEDMEQDTTAVILLEEFDDSPFEKNRHKKHRKTRKRHRNKQEFMEEYDGNHENGIQRKYEADQGFHHSVMNAANQIMHQLGVMTTGLTILRHICHLRAQV
ncbi:hypothetical protein TCAL_07594 [Tigriopus californicus]|uniref:Ig-like domain-containing protein n=1 Tax=Tigriopus californicus TaxID=6832 RepID=A0A553PG99_TIGCA|nr:hypothetical protein TCAL_07594 [Tigriopus californicus]